jgi:hypothetical protein
MRTSWIEIDEEVLVRIQAAAEAFVDSPNDVLRRTFGLAPAAASGCAPLVRGEAPARSQDDARPSPPGRLPRARRGEILPMEDYEIPVLRALAERGGSAHREEVAEAVGAMLADELTALDREPLQGGQVRWENRLGFARLRAIERGEMRADSRRGIWELTEAGAARLATFEHDRKEQDHVDDGQRPAAEAAGVDHG